MLTQIVNLPKITITNDVIKNEYIYIHLQKRKDMKNYCPTIVNGFWITNKGFLPFNNNEITMELLKNINEYLGEAYEYNEEMSFVQEHWKLKYRSLLSNSIIGRNIIEMYYNLKDKIENLDRRGG